MANSTPDFIVVGAGSAGCAVAAGLVERQAGAVTIVEAGPSDSGMLVRVPFGLVWLMNGKRDWRFLSAPQTGLDGRQLRIPRGRMLGGSASINSMVWFRGRRDDFDNWNVPGWAWADVEADFETVEARMRPGRLTSPHPLSEGFQQLLGGNGIAPPTPEYESAGVFHFNMDNGRRWSPADAFLRPAQAHGLKVVTGRTVNRLRIKDDRAVAVVFDDGTEMEANKGIVLSAGAIGSPAILLKSGIGPADDLKRAGVGLVCDDPGVGANLHDHPAAGIHFAGPGSGYGIALAQIPQWLSAPLRYLASGTGPLGSPTVEAGAFFNARTDGGPPDIQVHFIPFMLGWKGRRFVQGSGYFADVCVCRPKSRGRLSLQQAGIAIDLGIFSDSRDLDLLVDGWRRLRSIMAEASPDGRRAPEAYPGALVGDDTESIRAHIRRVAATAYHPVGTLAMGTRDTPVTPRLQYRSVDRLWVADASIMPAVTSANTNAPTIMIGHRAAGMIAEDAL